MSGGGLARTLYGALLTVLAPLVVARWWWRGRREPLYRHEIGERFGHYRGPIAPGAAWVHAVSLGETRAAAALIDALRTQRPGVRVLLTHGTATGREAGRALLREGDAQCWVPYDSAAAVRRFLAHARPAVGVLMETEIWPNLIAGARTARVPLVLANARLSERSLRRGQRARALLGPSIAAIDRVLAQTQADAARLRAAGATHVEAMGNLKFDVQPEPALIERGRAWAAASARPIVLAASTREGEEAPLLAAWRAGGPRAARLLVVPRHPQRFDEVAGLVAQAGLKLSRRSAWAADRAEADADVWLGDSLGEMPAYYAAAGVALLGGSFAPLGGQNLIEAAACACPVVAGPHTFNFAQAAEQAIDAGAALRAPNVEEGVERAAALAVDARARAAMSKSALRFAQAHRGAAQRMAEAVLAAMR